MALVLLCVSSGCGGAPASPTAGAGDCRAALDGAARSWSSVGDAAAAALPPEGELTEADRALARVEQHLAELEAAPHEIGDGEAMALSSAVMDAIDAAGTLPTGLRDRAEDAAEALLTDRSVEGGPRAARAAAEALEAVCERTHPGSGEERERRVQLGRLLREAQAIAAAYRGDDPSSADARAARTAVPEGAAAVQQAHAEALEASTAARQACRLGARIAVPSP